MSVFYWLQTEAPRADGGTGLSRACGCAATSPAPTDGLAHGALHPRVPPHPGRVHASSSRTCRYAVRGDKGAVALPRQRRRRHVPHRPAPVDRRRQLHRRGLVPVRDPARRADAAADGEPAAGGKNIGTTHITNGCYRLHPVEWNVGEVAGALAALLPGHAASRRAQVRNTPAPAGRLPGPARRATASSCAGPTSPATESPDPPNEDDEAMRPTRATSAASPLRAAGADRPAAAAPTPGSDAGPVTLRMTIWSANEAHLKLFNEIADEYKSDAPERHRDHLRPAPVRELHHDAHHADRRRQRARPGLDPGEHGARLRQLRRACAARRRRSTAPPATTSTSSAPARPKLLAEGRQALRLPVLDLAVRRVRQQRPDQGGRQPRPRPS